MTRIAPRICRMSKNDVTHDTTSSDKYAEKLCAYYFFHFATLVIRVVFTITIRKNNSAWKSGTISYFGL